MTFQHIHYEVADGRARITLNRPDSHNAITSTMLREMETALWEADDDTAVHCVILRGAGRSFCSGYDLTGLGRTPQDGRRSGRTHDDDIWLIEQNNRRVRAIWEIHKPAIAQVHGNCLAGGTDLALVCDMVIAADDARIGFPAARSMGALPSNLWMYHCGPQWAKRLQLTGDSVTGADAAKIGLVMKSVPADRLEDEVEGLADRLALIDPDLLAANKRITNIALELQGAQTLQRLAAETDARAHRSVALRDYRASMREHGLKETLRRRDEPFGDGYARVDETEGRLNGVPGRVNFDDEPDEALWRAECATWINEHLEQLAHYRSNGEMSIDMAKRWQAMKFDDGFAKIAWGPGEGGRNGTDIQQIIFDQEQAKHRTPPNVHQIGLDLIAPTIRVHGTEAQRVTYLRAALRGERIWCQMFSEPDAGSDVAGLATSAVRDGDEWILNGRKVWTTNAHIADYGEVLCRTDPDVPKHRGITAFILDMRAPGVTVSPLKQMTGTAEFNEISLDNVRVPHDNVLGTPGDGWHVAVTTLMNERRTIGAGGASRRSAIPQRLADLARRSGTLDAVSRQRIVDIHIRSEILRFVGLRTLTAAMHGRRPGPEGSIAKLAATQLNVDIGALGINLLGAAAMTPDAQNARWVTRFLWGPGYRLGGGTDEVNRNIVAERVLGLPGEPRDDDTLPWREVKKERTMTDDELPRLATGKLVKRKMLDAPRDTA